MSIGRKLRARAKSDAYRRQLREYRRKWRESMEISNTVNCRWPKGEKQMDTYFDAANPITARWVTVVNAADVYERLVLPEHFYLDYTFVGFRPVDWCNPEEQWLEPNGAICTVKTHTYLHGTIGYIRLIIRQKKKEIVRYEFVRMDKKASNGEYMEEKRGNGLVKIWRNELELFSPVRIFHRKVSYE